MYLGNTPTQETMLRVEARKSFSLAVWFTDSNGRSLDLTGCTVRLVAKAQPQSSTDITDADNLIVNSEAAISLAAEVGYCYFHLQASDLNHEPGEYNYAIVLRDAEGYSSTVVRGVLELLQNTEYASVSTEYTGVNPPTSLQVALRGLVTISVKTGPTLAPGTTSFTDADKAKLDGIEAGAQANDPIDWADLLNVPPFGTAAYAELSDIAIPEGTAVGEVLTWTLSGFQWATPAYTGGAGTLDATGAAAGEVPTANGAGSWSWDPLPVVVSSVNGQQGTVVLNMDSIGDTATRVAVSPAQRTKIDSLSLTPAWADITGKPTLGTAAAEDSTAFLPASGIDGNKITSGTVAAARLPKVTALQGFSSGTAAPTGGADGDFYFQYV